MTHTKTTAATARRTFIGILTTVAWLLAPAPQAHDGHHAEDHQMTPEQQAEMEAYMRAGTPGAQHQTLASSAGSYQLKIRSWHAPDAPPTEDTGTATRRMMLGGRVLVEEVSAAMMGTPFTGHGMHGYDNVTGKYWSTWTDSMSTGIMVSEGSCDSKHMCRFSGSWNDPIKKGPVTTKMTTRWLNPSTQLFEMFGPAKGGGEMKMMEIVYTRRK